MFPIKNSKKNLNFTLRVTPNLLFKTVTFMESYICQNANRKFVKIPIIGTAPIGLGIDNGKLFVCDGLSGLNIFDISATPHLELLETHTNILCKDVILNNNLLIAIGEGGIFQYDYSTLPPTKIGDIVVYNEATYDEFCYEDDNSLIFSWVSLRSCESIRYYSPY